MDITDGDSGRAEVTRAGRVVPRVLVVDDALTLAEQVGRATEGLRPRPEVFVCDGPAALPGVVADEGPFDVLVAGPVAATAEGLAEVGDLRSGSRAITVVLAFKGRPDVSLRDIIRVGAVDMVHLPVDDDTLAQALRRAVEVARRESSTAPAHPRPDDAPAPVPTGTGAATGTAGATLVTVASATGGCGKTFYATNLAYFLHHYGGKRTCLVDLDLQFGEVSAALRFRPTSTIHDLLARRGGDGGDGGDLGDEVEACLVTHDTGIHVLAAPTDPALADNIDPFAVANVLGALRERFDAVVVDTPAALPETVLTAFDLSDSLHVMATLDVASLRSMGTFLATLERLKVAKDRIRLVLNKVERDSTVELKPLFRLFPQGFSPLIPYSKDVSKSMNLGTPILASAPTGEVSRSIVDGLLAVLDEAGRARASSLLASKGGRRARAGRSGRIRKAVPGPAS